MWEFEKKKKHTEKHTEPCNSRLPFCGATIPEGGFYHKLTGSLDGREKSWRLKGKSFNTTKRGKSAEAAAKKRTLLPRWHHISHLPVVLPSNLTWRQRAKKQRRLSPSTDWRRRGAPRVKSPFLYQLLHSPYISRSCTEGGLFAVVVKNNLHSQWVIYESLVAGTDGIDAFLFVGIIPGPFIDTSNAYLDYDALWPWIQNWIKILKKKQSPYRRRKIVAACTMRLLTGTFVPTVSNSMTDTKVKPSAFVQHPAPSRSNADKLRIGKVGESFLSLACSRRHIPAVRNADEEKEVNFHSRGGLTSSHYADILRWF